MQSLAKKTAHLKWLKAISVQQKRAETQLEVETPWLDFELNQQNAQCRTWLQRQTQKQQKHRPKQPQAPIVELVLLASAAPKSQRDGQYNRRYEEGEANWYHIPATSLQDYTDEQIQQIAYLAIGITKPELAERTAMHLYAVASVQKMPRHMLTVEQAGSLKPQETMYWLFELSRSVLLAQPIAGFSREFRVKVAPAKQLLSSHLFDELIDVAQAV